MTLLSPLPGTLSPLGVSAGRRRGVQSEFCLGLNGAVGSGYIIAPNFGSKINGLPALTISFWFNQRVLDQFDFLLAAISSLDGSADIQISTYTDGTMTLEVGTGSAAYAVITGYSRYVRPGLWHLLTLVFDGSLSGNANRLKCYINGRQITIDTFSGTVGSTTGSWNSSDSLLIGTSTGASQALDGSLDDLRFYSSALSAAEVQSIYRNSSSPPSTGLVVYFPFEEGTGTTTTDTVGGLVATLTAFVAIPTWQPQTPPRLIAGRNTEEWSLSFVDTSSQSVNCGNAVTDSMNGDMAFSLWLKHPVSVNLPICAARNAAIGWELVTSNGKLLVQNSVGGYMVGTKVISDGAWHHVAFARVGSQYHVYVDGVNDDSADKADVAGNLGCTDPFIIGYLGRLNSYFTGQVKDVRIYASLAIASIATLARGKEPSETFVEQWDLNQGTGTQATGTNGNHGTLTNGPTWSGDLPQHFRQVIESSQALSCDGDDDLLLFDQFSIGTVHCVSAWIKVTVDNEGIIVGNTIGSGYSLYIDSAGAAGNLYYSPNGLSNFSRPHGGILGAYHHLAVIRNGANVTLYKNGVSLGSGSVTNDVSGVRSIGAYNTGQNSLQALIDEVLVATHLAAAHEIADQAAGFLVPAGLVSRYKFDGDALDSQGLNHGTEQGGVGYSASVPGTL